MATRERGWRLFSGHAPLRATRADISRFDHECLQIGGLPPTPFGFVSHQTVPTAHALMHAVSHTSGWEQTVTNRRYMDSKKHVAPTFLLNFCSMSSVAVANWILGP